MNCHVLYFVAARALSEVAVSKRLNDVYIIRLINDVLVL